MYYKGKEKKNKKGKKSQYLGYLISLKHCNSSLGNFVIRWTQGMNMIKFITVHFLWMQLYTMPQEILEMMKLQQLFLTTYSISKIHEQKHILVCLKG